MHIHIDIYKIQSKIISFVNGSFWFLFPSMHDRGHNIMFL